MKIKSQLKACKLLLVLTFMFCLSGRTYAQTTPVTLKVADVRLEQVLDAIEQQTTYLFVYNKDVDVDRKISVDVTNMALRSVLDQIFKSSNITYAVENTSVVLSVSNDAVKADSGVISGVVLDANGAPVIGAAIIVKGTTIGTSSNVDGNFSLQVPPPL